MFRLLRYSSKVNARHIKPELEKFLHRIKHLENNRFETRSFAYPDIISWVESKVYEKSLAKVVEQKYKKSEHRIRA